MNSRSFSIPLLLLAVACLLACNNQPVSEVRTETEVRYVQPERAAVTGQIEVSDSDAELSGILVFAEGTTHIAVTDRDGVFELDGLPAGGFVLRALRGDLEPLSLGEILVTEEDVKKDQPYQDLGIFEMKTGGWIARPVGSSDLTALGSITGRVNTMNPLDAGGVIVDVLGTPFRTVTDGSGAYSILNVPEGAYNVQFRLSGYESADTVAVVRAGEETTLSQVTLMPRDAGAILGRTILGSVTLIDSEGRPVTSEDMNTVLVLLEGTVFSTRPDAQGIFEFSGLPAQPFTVRAQAPGYILDSPAQVNLTELNTAEVSLRMRQDPASLDAAGLVIGQAVLEEGGPNGNGGITISLNGTSSIATTDSEGYFMIENVSPGTYQLTATYSGYKPQTVEGITVEQDQTEPTVAPPIELERQVERPRVLWARPNDGATDISIEDPTEVVIAFSQKMDFGSLREAFSISPDVDYQLVSRGNQDRMVVLLEGYNREGEILHFDTRYRIKIAETAQNQEGIAMEDPFEMRFTTGAAKIIRTWPPDEARGVFVNNANPIRIYFNTAIRDEGIEPSDIRFRPSLQSPPALYVQEDPETGWAYLSIGTLLQFDEEYEVTIRGRIQTLGGDRVSNIPYSFSFSTTERWEGRTRTSDRDRSERLREERDRY